MKYKNIAFIIIILSLWINPVNADSKVAPYADISTQHSANWPVNYMDAEFIQVNNNDRIRQNGDISKIKFDVANTSNLMEFYFTIWRKNVNGGYDRIAITDNLNGDISDGINEIELSVPISGVQEGDYYGYRIKTSGPALYVDTNEVRLTYFVNNSASPIENFDWEGCIDWRPYIFVIEPYMDDPHMIFIGDSIIVGIPQHLSFLHENCSTDIPSTIEYQWSNKVDDQIYQNMGYGGHGTPELRNRFDKDVVQLNPEFVLIEGGIIDIRRSGDRSGVIINNWRAMIEEAYNNDITPVIMLILPCTNISDLRSGRVDIINEQLITMAAEYSPSIVVDARSYVGIHRSGGDGGNLWDINSDYDSGDGLHFNSAGNERIAQAIKDSFKYIYGKPGLYNLIQSDGTIIYSEGLSNAINTSWRMASTSSTANVIYNDPSTDEIADFTINSGSIKWFTIYDLSQDQVYHLRRSDGTLIESSTALNGIVNFTMTEGLSTGTYHVDTSFVITDVNYDTPATDSVNITWETNKNSDSLVQYGTTSGNYSSNTSDQEMVISHSIELSGLSPGITYYFVVTSTDSNNDLAQSDEYFFMTADIADTTPPVISNITNTTPTTDSVTISWETDEDSDSLVKYGTESGSYIVDVPDIALVISHSIELSGLNSNTTYYYVVNSTDAVNNSAQSDEYFFTTAYNTTNEEISDLVKVFRKKVSTSRSKSGGGGAAGEDFNNIMISETQREFVCIGEDISYVFDSEDNIVRYINFTGYKTAGTIPAKVDMLNHTSSLVNYAPLDIVYKNLNIWVGNKGWANSKNIGNATINFNLEKSWINENNIDRSTIKMKRYYNGKWNILETTLIDQDVKYLYFESKIAGFSSFVITGKQRYTGEPDEPGEEGIEDDKPVAVVTETLNNTSVEAPTGDEIGIPGFGLFICLVVWLIVIWKIRKE
ncbi:MAG: Lysophospholipase L1 [Candidatus Methanomarinus sp.]|nr:Lysophospholipase L1 [ANME-2 cluster archaeon]KAF5428021.1 MAG: Lysophospholipase L1 [ANME-2 cluster archaeon]